ncbi:MAG: dihydroorotate dehydrogenase electron transfer subunit [Anaerolineae bacterium]|nr:dihydroorotate dehydrogenase electron transfer subunit [Anaerolineae bacterium]MDW8102447.1 dihydroorotate dehydrogenase electron transfer subunit [Anaerolineae bacterium]
MPTVHNLPVPFAIKLVKDESLKVKTFILDGKLEAIPGQFVMVWLPGVDEKPFSLVNDSPVVITVARVGPFTSQLHEKKPGDTLWLRGPYGKGFSIEGNKLLLVGGGYGVAPLLFLARRARAQGCSVDAVIGARCAEELIFVEDFRALGCQVHLATEDGSLGFRGKAPELVEKLIPELRPDSICGCGPEGMLEALSEIAVFWKLPAQFSYESYIRCGFGVCGSCERKGWLVCRDGPVRSLSQSL